MGSNKNKHFRPKYLITSASCGKTGRTQVAQAPLYPAQTCLVRGSCRFTKFRNGIITCCRRAVCALP